MAEDDWRVTVALHDEEHVGRLRQALHELELEQDVRDRLGTRVAVGEGDRVVFLYANTRESAREVERIVRGIVQAHGLDADFSIHRWHPIEERWEDERVPPPATEAELQAERRRRQEDEIAESERLGAALWEVRVDLDSHDAAVALAERLQAKSDALLPGWTVSVVRRWKYVLIGADTEEQAKEIVERLEPELPAGATIQVEPSGALAWRTMASNPFAVFGGQGS